MNNKNLRAIALLGLAIFAMIEFSGCVTTSASDDKIFSEKNAYDFKLVEPASHDINLNAKDKPKVDIKITFNTEKANADGAYYATFIDGKISRTVFGTDLKSPIKATQDAMYFFDGKYTVEYVLLPAGSMEKKDALAGVKLNLTISGSINKKDLALVDDLVAKMISAIQNNDEKAFADLFINKAKNQAIEKNITGNSKDALKSRELLNKLNSDKFALKSIEAFKKIQSTIKKNNIDVKTLKLKSYTSPELHNMSTSTLKAIGLISIFTSEKFSLYSDFAILLTKDKAYLVLCNPKERVRPR